MTEKTKATSNPILTGIKWTSIQFIVNAVFRFSIRLILAKLLFPEQFGLVGMAAVFISVATAASDLGMSAALIQRKEDAEVTKMYDTAFWTGLGWGLSVFLLMSFSIGPFAAFFYEEPLLLQLVPVLSLGIFIKPFSLIPTVILTRAMDFKTIAKINNSSAFGAGILSIAAALLGAGVWALAVNSVLAVVFAVPFLYLSTKWKPKRKWNSSHFRKIFGFGAYSSSTVVFSTITYNVDNLMIGKLLGASLLGSYTLAFSLTENLRQMTSGILNQVMYPVFGKNQEDKEKLRGYFLKIINFNALLIYPIMTFFLLFAEEIVLGFFGEKWVATIIPLQLLSVAMMLHLLVNSFTSLIRGLGKPKLEMNVIIGLTVFVLIPGLWLGISYYGLAGAACAILINKSCLVVIGIAILKKQIDLTIRQTLIAVKSALIGISLAGSSVLFLKFYEPFDTIYLLGPVFIASYLLIVYRLEKSSLEKVLKGVL